MAMPAVISVETLRRLLSAGALPEINDVRGSQANVSNKGSHETFAPPLHTHRTHLSSRPAQGDLHCRRKLSIASFVYSSWTANNTALAQLAPRFLDGSVAALESFVQADAAVEPAALPEVSQPRPTAQRGTVDRRDADTLPYDHFVTEYMAPNRPVVISGCGKDWPATRDWVNASDGSPNLDFMQQHFGHARVTVTDCSGGSRSEMTVSEYIDWLRDSRDSERVGKTAIKYLKDWHHFHEFRNIYQAYDLPAYFSEDWLNDWYDLQSSGRNVEDGRAPASDTGQPSNAARSDYRFVSFDMLMTKCYQGSCRLRISMLTDLHARLQ